MSYDLILKRSNINWARGGTIPIPQPTAPAATPDKLACTPEEKAKLAKIAAVKAAAGKGDRKARAQWQNLLAVGIPALKARAAKGDPKAKRDLQCLKASGLFAAPAAVNGEFIGAYPTQILGDDKELEARMQQAIQEGHDARRTKELGALLQEAKRNPNSRSMKELTTIFKASLDNPEPPYESADPRARKDMIILLKLNKGGMGLPWDRKRVTFDGEFIGAYPTQILGSDLNDDELAVAREGGASEWQALARVRGDFIGSRSEIGRRRRRAGKRAHHLKKIVKKAAQGDTNALNQMRQVQQRLSQRAASGDPRANTLLQRISQWYSQYQAQYQGTAQTQYPAYPQQYQAPYMPPQQPYPPYPGTPGAPADDEQELATTDPEL